MTHHSGVDVEHQHAGHLRENARQTKKDNQTHLLTARHLLLIAYHLKQSVTLLL
jgi:hypothetical protein